jgi:CRISPR-associated protein Cas2
MTIDSYWLIAYDITDNKLRLKVANRLIYIGLTRVQLSVFMGCTNEKILSDFRTWFETKILTLASDDCSLVIVPLSRGQMLNTAAIGTQILDKDELMGERHTLIL